MASYTKGELVAHILDNSEHNRDEIEAVVETAILMEEDGVWAEFYQSNLSPELLETVINELPDQGGLQYRWNWCAGLRKSYEHLDGYRV